MLYNCLPGISFDIAIEPPFSLNGKKKPNEEKKNKAKGEAIYQIEDGEEEQSNSSSATIKRLKQELKNDYGKTLN